MEHACTFLSLRHYVVMAAGLRNGCDFPCKLCVLVIKSRKVLMTISYSILFYSIFCVIEENKKKTTKLKEIR